MNTVSKIGAWLVQRNGGPPRRSPLARPVTCIGRAADNDVVVRGEQAVTVSSYHVEIRREGEQYRLYDRESTNGTYLNGRRVREVTLEPDNVIRLGPDGPEFVFETVEQQAAGVDRTVMLKALPSRSDLAAGVASSLENNGGKPGPKRDVHEDLLHRALERVRSARRRGDADQTLMILREMMQAGISHSSRPLKLAIGGLVVLLVAVAAYGSWAIRDLAQQKSDIDAQIAEMESRLEDGGQDPGEIQKLILRLNQYQQRARSLQESLFYQFTPEGRARIFVEREIETLLGEFGATEQDVPDDFVARVQDYIERYQGPDRPHMERTLGRARNQFARMRQLFEQDHLPPDLAYIVLVESAFVRGRTSQANAAGLWQFRPETAQQFGLAVNDHLDERFDVEKSTQAAARYVRSLILEFGSGNSVMLALAAYNTGPARVKRAVRKVKDPIKQRNFWYLYSTQALPRETRDYIPKLFAAIIIGRHPEQFGF